MYIFFNINSMEILYFLRTAAQLRKCWENLKTVRKIAVDSSRKKSAKTGGGPFEPDTVPEDPEMDAPDSVNIELVDSIDSDTMLFQDHYILVDYEFVRKGMYIIGIMVCSCFLISTVCF